MHQDWISPPLGATAASRSLCRIVAAPPEGESGKAGTVISDGGGACYGRDPRREGTLPISTGKNRLMRTVVGVLWAGLISLSGQVCGAAEANPEPWVGRWEAEVHWQERWAGRLGVVSEGGQVKEPWTVELTPTKLIEAGRTVHIRSKVERWPDGAEWVSLCTRRSRGVLGCEDNVRVTSGGRLVLRRAGEGMLMSWTFFRRVARPRE